LIIIVYIIYTLKEWVVS